MSQKDFDRYKRDSERLDRLERYGTIVLVNGAKEFRVVSGMMVPNGLREAIDDLDKPDPYPIPF